MTAVLAQSITLVEFPDSEQMKKGLIIFLSSPHTVVKGKDRDREKM